MSLFSRYSVEYFKSRLSWDKVMKLDLKDATILEGDCLNYLVQLSDGRKFEVEIGGYEYELDVYPVKDV